MLKEFVLMRSKRIERQAPRRGFTLVELLVVLAIIILVASLTLGGTMAVISRG